MAADDVKDLVCIVVGYSSFGIYRSKGEIVKSLECVEESCVEAKWLNGWSLFKENVSKSTWIVFQVFPLLKNLLAVIETDFSIFVGKTYVMHAKQCHRGAICKT